MSVQVPQGMGPGMTLQVQTPSGQLMQVPIPQGFGPGMSFQCQVPAAPQAAPMSTNTLNQGLIQSEHPPQSVGLRAGWMQNLIVGLVCFCCPGIFNSLTGLGDAGGSDPQVASAMNATLYGVFAIFGFFGGSLYNIFGARLLLFFGAAPPSRPTTSGGLLPPPC